jgi:hypothetical protein
MIVNLFKKKKARVIGPRVRSWIMSVSPLVKSYGQSLTIILLQKGHIQDGINEQTRFR